MDLKKEETPLNRNPAIGANDVTAPRLWSRPAAHRAIAADSGWYRMLTRAFGVLFETTVEFYRDRGIGPALMPITVSSVSSPMGLGSDSLPVSVDLLGDRVYLADSMQFQLEFILRHGGSGAYYLMPSFRGEDPDETHLNQFFHSEAEIVGGLEDVIDLVENYLHTLTRALLTDPVRDVIATSAGGVAHLEKLLSGPRYARISFNEAMNFLGDEYFDWHGPLVPAITRRGEWRLIEEMRGPVWLTHPPHLSVPFYQRCTPDGLADSADLLLGPGEIVGCGARHRTEDETCAALASHAVEPDDYKWYLEMKRTHPMETAGFGLGLERYLLWVLQHDDIRDLHVMPRLKGVPVCL